MMPENLDMNALLAQAQQMQAEMAKAQQELAESKFTGSAGGGLVTAEVTGDAELVSLTIKPEACDPEDTESLADLVIAAVRDAQAQMRALAQAKFSGMPGMDGFGL